MKIAILTIGTRGDVQPYAVLGRALAQRGHRVTLATAWGFEHLVESYNIGFQPVAIDISEMLGSEEGVRLMRGNLIAMKRALSKWVFPLVEESLESFYQLVRSHDKVLYRPKTLCDVFAASFPEKMIRLSVVPDLYPTTAFLNPLLSGLPLPKALNKWSYGFSPHHLLLRLLSAPINRFRQRHGLETLPFSDDMPTLYGISPAFLAPPDDYPYTQQFTGFWFDEADQPLSEPLERFLAAGPPPLVVTFGSMHVKTEVDLEQLLLQTVERFGQRIILINGWSGHQLPRLQKQRDVLVVDSAPHAALFPRVKAVIHHGGVGTTAACLRAGLPMFICPVLYPIGDQQFWGEQSEAAGVGVQPLVLNKLTEDTFLERVEALLTQEALYQNAKRISKAVRAENGLYTAVEAIERTETGIAVRA